MEMLLGNPAYGIALGSTVDKFSTRAAAVGGADLSGQMGWPHSMAQQRIPELPTGLPMGPPNGMQPDALSHQPHNPLEVASRFFCCTV